MDAGGGETGEKMGRHLLVDPSLADLGPVVELLRSEPEGNLLLGALDGVRAVADVAANLDAEVATDGAGQGVVWAGLTKELAAKVHGICALPDLFDGEKTTHTNTVERKEPSSCGSCEKNSKLSSGLRNLLWASAANALAKERRGKKGKEGEKKSVLV